MIAGIIMLAGLVAGAAGGAYANEKTRMKMIQDQQRAATLFDLRKKQNERNKLIAKGDLDMAALGATSNNREAAMAAWQQQSMGEVAVGASGTSAGSAYYKLDQDIRDMRMKLNDQEKMGANQVTRARLNMEGAEDQGKYDEQAYRYSLSDSEAALGYQESGFKIGADVLSGAFQGLQAGISINNALYGAGIFKEKGTPGTVDDPAFNVMGGDNINDWRDFVPSGQDYTTPYSFPDYTMPVTAPEPVLQGNLSYNERVHDRQGSIPLFGVPASNRSASDLFTPLNFGWGSPWTVLLPFSMEAK